MYCCRPKHGGKQEPNEDCRRQQQRHRSSGKNEVCRSRAFGYSFAAPDGTHGNPSHTIDRLESKSLLQTPPIPTPKDAYKAPRRS